MKNPLFVCLNSCIVTALLVPAVLVGQSSPAPAPPAGITVGPSVEGITEYELQNGLRVLLFPDPTKTTTTLNITYLVGSRNENYGETGMAHLLEHMMFRGSTNHRNVNAELTLHGARANGTTWFDRTNYFETFEGTDENLTWALALEADRMVNSFIAKKDLDSEMTVVRNEFEMGENNPANILEERVLSTAYLWHNYGKSTIGARSDIEHVPIERLQAFYHLYYQPDNSVLTIAGHVDEAKTLALVAKYFGPIPKPARVIQKTYTEEPLQDGERTVTLRRVGDNKVVIVGVHVPALASPNGPLANVLNDVFTNAPSGRLYKALVETKKAGSVSGEATDTREPGMLVVMAEAPGTADLDDLEKNFLGVVDDMENHPPTEEEVNRSKAKLARQFDLLVRDSGRLGVFLSEYIASGDWRLAFITRDRIAAATTSDVDDFAKTYLKESNRTIGLFIPTQKPDRSEIPPAPDIAEVVKNYKGGAAIAPGEAFDPSPSNIDKRTIRGELQPGIKLALVSKKTRGSVVHATMRLHFGDENNLRDRSTVAKLAGLMLMRGTTKHTRQQIADELDRLKAQVQINGSVDEARISIETTKENLTAVMDLTAEVLREPSFPESEFESLKQQQLTELESQRTEPMAIAFQNASRHTHPYPKDDPRYVPTFDEEIAELKAATLEQIRSFYEAFYGSSHAELAVAGDFEPEALETQTKGLFDGWTSKEHYARVMTNYQDVPAVKESYETPDKANATFVAVQLVKMTDDSREYPALLIANYMLGGGFLSSRLASRIRVKDGLSYGIGSNLRVPTKEDAATFMAYAISAPQNTSRVETDFVEEMKRAINEGFTDQELAAAKSGWLQAQQVSREQDRELTGKLAEHTFWDRTMQWDADLERRVSELKTVDVNAALRKYIEVSKINIFEAGDFAKSKASAVPAGTPQ